jgi:hypothetical protein
MKTIMIDREPREPRKCSLCGEPVLARDLCAKHYRQQERSEKVIIDPHTPTTQQRSHHNKLYRAYSNFVSGKIQAGLTPQEWQTVLAVILPYFHSIADLIPELKTEQPEDDDPEDD